LGNVLAAGAPLRAHATIGFRIGATEQTAEWSPDAAPVVALAAVNVFDAQCAPVYLRDRTDVAFRPFSLDVFDKLSTSCGELRKRLDREVADLNRAPVALPAAPPGTRVATTLAGLTSLTKPDDIRALATLSRADDDHLRKLRTQLRDLQAGDAKKRAQELDLKASRIDRVATHVDTLVSILGDAALRNVATLRGKRDAAKTALEHLRRTVVTSDVLPGTGQEHWRQMWDAAAKYSPQAYPQSVFPVVLDGARCLLCQQSIASDAASRFKHFQELVASTAQSDVRITEAAFDRGVGGIRTAAIEESDLTVGIAEVETDDPGLAETVRDLTAVAAKVKDLVIAAVVAGAPLPASGVQPGPEVWLRVNAKECRERAVQLRKEALVMDPKDLAALLELEGRETLRGHLDEVLHEIERKKRIAAYGQCIEDTNTYPVTRKSTELTTRLITKRLQVQFQTELQKLEFADLSVEIRSAGGERGALYHQLVFTNAPGVVVATVLSEGESRALSLAAFLTELSTAPAASTIVFDDPVSSLDHIWRERIARRLVEEAKVRQVIVFTHDLVFLRLLMKECDSGTVQLQHQYVRRDSSGAGRSSPELPWVAMPLKDRIGRLRSKWQAAEKVSRTSGAEPYETDAREIYGLLREAWEQGIEEVLLNDVIERYRHSIETRKLRQLHDISAADCAAVEAAMTECSRWIRGHDHPAADGTPFPSPADLKQRIEDLDSWSQGVRKRREKK
jgi:AAA domain